LKFISDTKWLSLITETYLKGLDAHNNPANGSEPEQVLPDVDEGAGVGCFSAGLGGSILRSSFSLTANVSDPKVNWVPKGNFMSKVQGGMVFPDGS
jgi:hypothetical protein